jgi:hypothetical protein
VALPKAIRSRTPEGLRDLPWLRALALGAGLIPPRVLHSPGEAELLAELARDARCVVEIGVYEGSSALVFCDAMPASAELHLIDPYPKEAGAALFAGWRGSPRAAQLVVRRGHRGTGPHVNWHLERSQDVGRKWGGPSVDLVFIDGDHSAQGCREDWDMWHAHVRPGGSVAFHDARLGQPGGDGGPGPSQVVDELFRGSEPPAGYRLATERERLVVVRRTG